MRRGPKHYIVKIAASAPVGTALQRLTGNRVRARRATYDVSGWEPHLAAAIAFRLYERTECRYAIKYLGDSERVLELGGNRGVVSSALLHRLPPTAHLVSVEANPGLVGQLQDNLAHNRGPRRAEGRHLAVSDGEVVLFDDSRGALGSAMSRTTGTPVPTTTLAALVHDLGWDDFVLISDIEGAEAAFIEGTDTGLDRCTRLVIELHATPDSGKTVDDLITVLEQRHGFRLVARHRDVCAFFRGALPD